MPSALDPAVVTRCLVFVVSLLTLIVAHQVGDHVVQTDRQAAGKAAAGWRGVRAMAGHLLSYHAVAAFVVVGTFSVLGLPLTLGGTLAGLGFSAVTHAFLDRRWPVRAVLHAARAPQFAAATTPVCGAYQADQALHYLALGVSALLIAAV